MLSVDILRRSRADVSEYVRGVQLLRGECIQTCKKLILLVRLLHCSYQLLTFAFELHLGNMEAYGLLYLQD